MKAFIPNDMSACIATRISSSVYSDVSLSLSLLSARKDMEYFSRGVVLNSMTFMHAQKIIPRIFFLIGFVFTSLQIEVLGALVSLALLLFPSL
jgi:hypothetical protein